MNTWFTADNHFGHANVIKYAKRPFRLVEEMDAVMIERWNEMVRPEDTVYHLGDFTLSGTHAAQAYLNRLNGCIKILSNPWHNDKRWLPHEGHPAYHSKSALKLVRVLSPMCVLEFPSLSPLPIVLCHYPIAEWNRKHRGAWHLHGHGHGKYQGDGLILDVGVDCHDFYPISLARVGEIMREKAND